MMWFGYRNEPRVLIPLNVDSVHSILSDNAKGEMPEELIAVALKPEKAHVVESHCLKTGGTDSLTRFDKRVGVQQKPAIATGSVHNKSLRGINHRNKKQARTEKPKSVPDQCSAKPETDGNPQQNQQPQQTAGK